MARARPLLNTRTTTAHSLFANRTRLLIWLTAAVLCALVAYIRWRDFATAAQDVALELKEGDPAEDQAEQAPPIEHQDVIDKPETMSVAAVLRQAQSRACFTDKCTAVKEKEPETNVTLLIGVLSSPEKDVDFRQAARDSWVATARKVPGIEVIFFFSEGSEALAAEQQQHGDLVIADGPIANHTSGTHMLMHLSEVSTARLIMRVDVNYYVVVQRLLNRLRQVCKEPDCRGEQLWAGNLIEHRKVEGPGTEQYQWDTGLTTFLPYMTMEAYIISRTLAAALKLMHDHVGLRWWVSTEDTAMALWLVPVPIKRINLSHMMLLQSKCCMHHGRAQIDVCKKVEAPDGHESFAAVMRVGSKDGLLKLAAEMSRC